MVLYHGSSIGNLHTLKPCISEHNEPYIYFATDPVVASLYTVHILDRPYNYFPYGFDKNGVVVYTEYYKNAFKDVYNNKIGYLYECDNIVGLNNPTNINCAYTCKSHVNVDRCTIFENVYHEFLKWEEQGKFFVRKFETLSENEILFAENYLRDLIIKDNLKSKPNISQSKFIIKHFLKVWETTDYR